MVLKEANGVAKGGKIRGANVNTTDTDKDVHSEDERGG